MIQNDKQFPSDYCISMNTSSIIVWAISYIYIYTYIYILINQFVYLFIYLFVTYIHTTIWYSIIQHVQRNIQQIQHRMHMPFTDTIALWENSLIDAPWGPCRRAWARPRCCPLCCGFAMPPGEAPFHLGMVYMIYLWWCGKMCVFFFNHFVSGWWFFLFYFEETSFHSDELMIKWIFLENGG